MLQVNGQARPKALSPSRTLPPTTSPPKKKHPSRPYMAYYTNLFSPETYQTFGQSNRTISGFRENQQKMASKIAPGDRLICYMTTFSRWIGVLEVTGDCFIDDTPLFYPESDPFVVRFPVEPVVWLTRDHCIPVHEDTVWKNLSFTRNLPPKDSGWTGIVRRSLNSLSDADGAYLERLLLDQKEAKAEFPVDPIKFEKSAGARLRRADKLVSVTVPDNEDGEAADDESNGCNLRESYQLQALLARCGEQMGFSVWLPSSDRTSVQKVWQPNSKDSLLNQLPLSYDETTLRTIENIDVLWLRGRSIVRAFEVEHTTAVYSGILRMADLLALQPNMDIQLHIVAPESRKEKVFSEIRRPVFSFLERGPLSECCSYLSYDSIQEIAGIKQLSHLSDSVLEDYAEHVD